MDIINYKVEMGFPNYLSMDIINSFINFHLKEDNNYFILTINVTNDCQIKVINSPKYITNYSNSNGIITNPFIKPIN
jgi:hypothetical protein